MVEHVGIIRMQQVERGNNNHHKIAIDMIVGVGVEAGVTVLIEPQNTMLTIKINFSC